MNADKILKVTLNGQTETLEQSELSSSKYNYRICLNAVSLFIKLAMINEINMPDLQAKYILNGLYKIIISETATYVGGFRKKANADNGFVSLVASGNTFVELRKSCLNFHFANMRNGVTKYQVQDISLVKNEGETVNVPTFSVLPWESRDSSAETVCEKAIEAAFN